MQVFQFKWQEPWEFEIWIQIPQGSVNPTQLFWAITRWILLHHYPVPRPLVIGKVSVDVRKRLPQTAQQTCSNLAQAYHPWYMELRTWNFSNIALQYNGTSEKKIIRIQHRPTVNYAQHWQIIKNSQHRSLSRSVELQHCICNQVLANKNPPEARKVNFLNMFWVHMTAIPRHCSGRLNFDTIVTARHQQHGHWART